MNINKAIDKEWEGKKLSEIANAPISALQGISEEGGAAVAKAMRIKTVKDLSKSKYVKWAQAIVALADTEE